MYLGHSILLAHPSGTVSYETQLMMHHAFAFQHRAGHLADLVLPLRNVFVQAWCTSPCPLLCGLSQSVPGKDCKQEVGLVNMESTCSHLGKTRNLTFILNIK